VNILALGDCNTLGVDSLKHNAYTENFGDMINAKVLNLGKAMLCTREGLLLFEDHFDNQDIITIQFGLVDSWKTFKFSPYVLYYPDNWKRKFYRKLVKKYKKLCRQTGLNTLLGTSNVVGKDEYINNIETIIATAKDKLIFLIDTVPNQTASEDIISKNKEIRLYNSYLDLIAIKNKNVIRIKLYDYFEGKLDQFYHDETHINKIGYTYIAKQLFESYMRASK